MKFSSKLIASVCSLNVLLTAVPVQSAMADTYAKTVYTVPGSGDAAAGEKEMKENCSVTITVYDEETGELFSDDSIEFALNGGPDGAGNKTYRIVDKEDGTVGSELVESIPSCKVWKTSENNPVTVDGLSYSDTNDGYYIECGSKKTDCCIWSVDSLISEKQFDFEDSTEKNIKIYMQRLYYIKNDLTRSEIDAKYTEEEAEKIHQAANAINQLLNNKEEFRDLSVKGRVDAVIGLLNELSGQELISSYAYKTSDSTIDVVYAEGMHGLLLPVVFGLEDNKPDDRPISVPVIIQDPENIEGTVGADDKKTESSVTVSVYDYDTKKLYRGKPLDFELICESGDGAGLDHERNVIAAWDTTRGLRYTIKDIGLDKSYNMCIIRLVRDKNTGYIYKVVPYESESVFLLEPGSDASVDIYVKRMYIWERNFRNDLTLENYTEQEIDNIDAVDSAITKVVNLDEDYKKITPDERYERVIGVLEELKEKGLIKYILTNDSPDCDVSYAYITGDTGKLPAEIFHPEIEYDSLFERFMLESDEKVKKFCDRFKLDFISFDDALKQVSSGTKIEFTIAHPALAEYEPEEFLEKIFFPGKYFSITPLGEMSGTVTDKDGNEVSFTDCPAAKISYTYTGKDVMMYEAYRAAYISLSDIEGGYIIDAFGDDPDSIKKGDLNGDSNINIADAIKLQRFVMGSDILSEEEFLAADLNCDGVVNVYDFCLMKKQLTESEQ